MFIRDSLKDTNKWAKGNKNYWELQYPETAYINSFCLEVFCISLFVSIDQFIYGHDNILRY